jgi:hypothetical protein
MVQVLVITRVRVVATWLLKVLVNHPAHVDVVLLLCQLMSLPLADLLTSPTLSQSCSTGVGLCGFNQESLCKQVALVSQQMLH